LKDPNPFRPRHVKNNYILYTIIMEHHINCQLKFFLLISLKNKSKRL
jgi:hypothetical protein